MWPRARPRFEAKRDRAERGGLERLALRGRPGRRHGGLDPGGKDGTIGPRAVVVLARGHVPAAARGVDLDDVGQGLLPRPPGEAHEVRRHLARAVVAHRVDGIRAQRQERLVLVPEAEGPQPGIDQPFGRRVGLRIVRRARAVVGDAPVRTDVAPVRRDPVDHRLADAHVGDPSPGTLEGRRERPGHRADRGCGEGDVADGARRVARLEQALGLDVDDRRVVLMDRRDQDPLGVRARHRRQLGAPGVVGFVADLAPIDRDEHDRLRQRPAGEHEPDGFEWVDHDPGRRDPAAHAGVPDRDRHVGGERVERPRRGQTIGAIGRHDSSEIQAHPP